MTAARRVHPFSDPLARAAAGTMGMRLFLLSLGILFAAAVIGYLWVRVATIGDAVELPGLPPGLWLSTALLVAGSGTIQWALGAARRGRRRALGGALALTLLLGVSFLAVQTWCWLQWRVPMREALGDAEKRFLLTGFYVLTGLHALHVVGGLVPVAVITVRSLAGRYTPDHHPGVSYTVMYWHFLGAVWLVLFATFMIGS